MTRSPYEILGVPKNATDDELKKAYRKLARQYHPDANPGDAAAEEHFKEVQGAYDVLSDPEKRSAFDAFGQAGARGGFPGGADMGGARFEEFDLSNLGDLLGGMFGGGGRRSASRQPIRGNDLEAHVRISFEDSLKGVQVRVPVEAETACSVCHGTGAEPGSAPVTCPQCGGAASCRIRRACLRSPSRARAAAATGRSSRSRAGTAAGAGASGRRSGTR